MRKESINKVKVLFYVAAIFVISNVKISAAATAATKFLPQADVETHSGDDCSVYAEQDQNLFRGIKNLMPGAQVSNTVLVKNNSTSEVLVYLKAYSDYRAEGNGAVRSDGKSPKLIKEEGKRFCSELLDQITMTIKTGDIFLYTGPASGTGQLVNGEHGIPIGLIERKSQKSLQVILTLPGTQMTNEYINDFGAVDWTFIVEKNETSGSDTDSPGESDQNEDILKDSEIVAETLENTGMNPGSNDVNVIIEDPPTAVLEHLAKTGGQVLYLKQVTAILVVLVIGLFTLSRIGKKKF